MRHGPLYLSLAIAFSLSACGQVITLTPTPTPAPTPTVEIVALATLPPTATPAPYTPAPTATPTVTPTPIFYAIKPGDSLLGVAQSFDVSVAAIQEANGILDPRTLQIGQQLVIPLPEDEQEELANATPTPTPLPITVQNVHFSETTIGGLWVLGEVQNSSGQPLEQVRVAVALLDKEEVEIGRASGLVALDLLEVNDKAPFALLFGTVPSQFARYLTFPVSALPAYVGSYYRDLVVENVESEGERYAAYTVTGTVRNVGPEDAVSVQVILTAYDALDRVVAMRKVPPEHNVVAPGGTTTFRIVLAPVGGPVARIAAVAQGRRRSAANP
ncbi:MAG: LysM peptidoglycan-binding domain-containing protein [Chloroflexi bacterium]|nr:MAG: LysM peptidoglycan-binding domain-containing protein [Chloroflexota bacterium]